MVSRELLEEYAGTLVDRKATFGKSLQPEAVDCNAEEQVGLPVAPYPTTTASPELYALAIAAGIYSRFAIDPHIQMERFEAMYRLWIDRSVRGELADAVLVVPLDKDQAATGRLAGMITLASSNCVATIGLVAVSVEMRGRGIGATLMRAAERWMIARNACEARVVTQLSNTPACRLYERSGYRLLQLQHYYHFWL